MGLNPVQAWIFWGWSFINCLRLLWTFAGVLPCSPGKNSYARHFKGKHGKLYIVGKLNKCRFQKKYELPVFFNSTKENCKNDRENDHASFRQTNEWIGHQNSADFCEIWAKRSLDIVKQKCWGSLKFIIFLPWRSSMQCPWHTLCYLNLTD